MAFDKILMVLIDDFRALVVTINSLCASIFFHFDINTRKYNLHVGSISAESCHLRQTEKVCGLIGHLKIDRLLNAFKIIVKLFDGLRRNVQVLVKSDHAWLPL